MKLEKLNLESSKLEKSKMTSINGGKAAATSTTVYSEPGGCGVTAEMEYPDDGGGCPDYGAGGTCVDLPL